MIALGRFPSITRFFLLNYLVGDGSRFTFMEKEGIDQLFDFVVKNVTELQREPIVDKDEVTSYLEKLCKKSVSSLRQEPSLLEKELQHVQDRLNELAVGGYASFIECAACMKTSKQQFGALNNHLNEILEKEIPHTRQTWFDFLLKIEKNEAMEEESERASEQQKLLRRLGEIPEVMEVCLKRSYYDEVLDLLDYIDGLARDDTVSSSMLHKIAGKIHRCCEWLVSHCVHHLSNEELPLTDMLRFVTYLRRTQFYTEYELKELFLKCREKWFLVKVGELGDDDELGYLRNYVNLVSRLIRQVMREYLSVFAIAADPEGCPMDESRYLLSAWVVDRLNHMHQIVCQTISNMKDASELSMAFMICWRCIQELRNEGIDGGSRIKKAFGNVVTNLFNRTILQASQKFIKEISERSWTDSSLGISRGEAIRSLPQEAEGETIEEKPDFPAVPPAILTKYPLYAHFMNAYLQALNLVQQIPYVMHAEQVLHGSRLVLQEILLALDTLYQLEIWKNDEKQSIREFSFIFRDFVLPHIHYCLGVMFPREPIIVEQLFDNLGKQIPEFMTLDDTTLCT
jgi:hypothetical protein